uniref:Uncharacterized protein n=1 Tax=Cyprinus carpio TaxID=7962 RepID=A0A8C1V9Q5_CYPCA
KLLQSSCTIYVSTIYLVVAYHLMVWGAISASGTGDLVNIDGIINKKVYHNIFRPVRLIMGQSNIRTYNKK